MSFITPEMVFAIFAGACLLTSVIYHEHRKSRKEQKDGTESPR